MALLSRLRKMAPAAFMFTGVAVYGQSPVTGLEHLFTTPRSYTVHYVPNGPAIDGDMNDAVWQHADWSDSFTDIEGDRKPKPSLYTRVKMLWGDSCLYIAAKITEPHVWATLTKRDQVIFNDNDFEVFIDPDNDTHNYFEIEMNALNTIFDLFMATPYRNGSGALIPYDTPGLRTAVKVQGTLNDPSDTDESWTVELAIPFRALTIGNDTHIPAEGELWRINFSRVEWDVDIHDNKYTRKRDSTGRLLPEHNWVWSAQGVVNMHYPERWGYLRFAKTTDLPKFELPHSEKQRQFLWLIYYKQKAFQEKNGRYAKSMAELGIDDEVLVDRERNMLSLQATSFQFTARIAAGNKSFTIDDKGSIITYTAD